METTEDNEGAACDELKETEAMKEDGLKQLRELISGDQGMQTSLPSPKRYEKRRSWIVPRTKSF